MKNKLIGIVVASGVVWGAATAQHVKVFDGRTGQAHGAGGGGGAGKVHVHDISISKSVNTVLAFPPGFAGGVRVAAGDVDSEGMTAMLKTARKGEVIQSTFTLTFSGQTTAASPAARAQSQNNLKQMGIGIHNLASMQVGFLKPAGEGKAQEFATYRIHNVTLKRGVMEARSGEAGHGKQMDVISISFTGLEVAPAAIGAANGGIWKTTNFVDPNTGEMRIGLLLPAVQKIRD